MEIFPRFGLEPLSPEEVNKAARRIASDTIVNCPLPSTKNAGWSSKDLLIGRLREEPLIEVPASSSNDHDDRHSRNIQAEQFDQGIQRDMFAFIGSDVRVELALDQPYRWIRIRGINRLFYHYQVYAAYYLLLSDRGPRRGTVLADMMGLGKTTIAYLYMILNCILTEMSLHRRHHPAEHLTDRTGTQCPSQLKWPVMCSCVSDGVTNRRQLGAIAGPSLVMVPASLLSTWSLEWEAMGVHADVNLRLYIHHHHIPESRRVPLAQRHHLRLTRQAGGQCQLLSEISHRFLVLTTVESYGEQIGRCFNNINCRGGSKPSSLNRFPDDHDGVGWARVIKDEAHLTINFNTQFYQIMQSFAIRAYQSPNFLPITATPRLRNGIGDMLSVIRTINDFSPDLRDDPRYTPFTSERGLKRLQKQQQAVRTVQLAGKQADPIQERQVAETTGQLDIAYTIRRRNDSIQNGKGLAILPPISRIDVECTNTAHALILEMQRVEWLLKKQISHDFKEKKSKWQREHLNQPMREVELDMFLDNAQVPRILATVPGMTECGQNRQMFTWEHIEQQEWHERPEDSWFAENIDQLEGSSGKLIQLRALLATLGVDVQGRPEKLVVVSEFPVVCLITLVLLRSLTIEAKWMHAKLDTTEREALAGEFQADRVEVAKDVPCQVLIGSSKILGQGITLNRAFRLVLMEPSRHLAVEEQIFKRIHRIGSVTDRCWTYRLINPASRVEGLLIADQHNQLRNELLAQRLTEVGSPSALDSVDWSMRVEEQEEKGEQTSLAM